VLDRLEAFMTTTLGKGVVRAKDTPNFIANRVGIFGILATIHEANKFGIPCDVVDDLTGARLGRAKSATFRTADVVGLDTVAHVIKTQQRNLPDDPFQPIYATPPALQALIAKGALGQKSGAGFYKKVGKRYPAAGPGQGRICAGRAARPMNRRLRMLKEKAAERLRLLRASGNPQAQFLWAIQRDASTTRRCTWRASPTARATSTWRCAGASAPGRAPSKLWHRPAGSSGAVGQGGHRRRQGAVRCAAARLGVRRPQRRAHPRRQLEPGATRLRAAQHAAGLCPPGLP
jgi:hypothetical protein